MIICFKRSKMILATIVVLLIIPAIMAVSKYICPEDTAKAVSTVFENQATSDKALVYLFMDRDGCTGGKITAATFAAEDAAAGSNLTVPVGTGHAAI